MEGLRGVLAVAGVLVIGFVYWWSVREQRRRNQPTEDRIEPTWHDESAALDDDDELPAELQHANFSDTDTDADAPAEFEADAVVLESAAQDSEEPSQSELEIDPAEEPRPEKIVALRIAAREADTFPGEELILTMRGLGLRHGKFGIFHHHEGDDDAVVFSVANLLEPGSFDLANIKDQSFPGVSLFLVLPGPVAGPQAFDRMVGTARTLAKTLGGEVLDANGSSFSIQRERFIREEIIQYEHGVNFG